MASIGNAAHQPTPTLYHITLLQVTIPCLRQEYTQEDYTVTGGIRTVVHNPMRFRCV